MKKLGLLLIIATTIFNLNAQNKVTVLAGATYPFEMKKVNPSAGLMYEYKDLEVTSLVGYGVITTANFKTDLVVNGGAAVFIHPDEAFTLGISPGIGYTKFSTEKLINDKLKNTEMYFNLKIFAAYNFQINDLYYVTPIIATDVYKNYASMSLLVGFGLNF